MTPQSPAPVAGDEWTPWTGGPRPHPPATYVRVRYRDGTEDEGQSAFARWWHDEAEPERDIIAFRLSRPASEQPVEAIGAGREEIARVIRDRAQIGGTDWQRNARGADINAEELADLIAALPPASPARTPMGEPQVLKGVGKINGDGWKDTTSIGEVVYVWNAEKPSPYAPGQYPRIDNEGWSASTAQYDFSPASVDEVRALTAPTPMGGDREHSSRCWGRTSFSDEVLHCYCQTAPTPMGEPAAWRIGDDGAVYATLKAARNHVDGWRLQGAECSDPQPLYDRQALAASSPSPAQGGEQIARKAEMYDHMREVAAANGFDSLTQAIAEAYAARQAVSASPQPEAVA